MQKIVIVVKAPGGGGGTPYNGIMIQGGSAPFQAVGKRKVGDFTSSSI